MSIVAPALEQPVLSARSVTKRYAAVPALVDVSIAIRRGEIVALCGENGSGKSTLARCLAGVVRPDTGDVLLDGVPRAFDQPRDAIDAGVALVTQDLTAVPGMSVAENVLLTKLCRATTRVRRSELASGAVPYLEAVGLDVDPGRPFATLRPGERELVEIAKALASHPRVLIVDEATARLPEPERLLALVDRLRADGLGVLFITHRLHEIRRAADRAVVLRDGRVVGELDRPQLSEEQLSSMMVGRELAELYDKPNVSFGQPVLRVERLTTDRSRVPISFTVRQGEIVGLAGLVGSGRSELLETIAGVRGSRQGTVVVGSTRVSPGSTASALRLGLSFVPEDRHRLGLVVDASVRENITLSSLKALALVDRKRQRAAAGAAVDQLTIRCAGIEAPVRTLSGGNQQKVVLARCLAGRPRVLLLDEPTRGVDVGARAEIYRIVGERIGAGMAIVLASSELPEILGLSDRILVLHEGAVVAEVDRSNATEELLARLSAGGGAARVS